MVGALVFEDLTFGLKAVIIFNPIMKSGSLLKWTQPEYAGKTDDFKGLIYKPDTKKTPSEKFEKFKDINDVKKEISKIDGSWLRNITFDGKEYWDIADEEMRPVRGIPDSENVLPSDWRYREDLIYLHREDITRADAWKV